MFAKIYHDDVERKWKWVYLTEEQAEQMRIESIDAALDLYMLILAQTKRKFPDMHPFSQERLALAVFDKKESPFYGEIQEELNAKIMEMQGVFKREMEKNNK